MHHTKTTATVRGPSRAKTRASKGATMVDYGILMGLLAALTIAVIYTLGTSTSETMSTANSGIERGMASSQTPSPTTPPPSGFAWAVDGTTRTGSAATPEAGEGLRVRFQVPLAGSYAGSQALLVLNTASAEISDTSDAAGAYGLAGPPVVQQICAINGATTGPCGTGTLTIDPGAWESVSVVTSWGPDYAGRHLRGDMALRMEPLGAGDDQQVLLSLD